MKTILRTQGTVELSKSDLRDLIVQSLVGKGFEVTTVRGLQPITCNIVVTDKVKRMIPGSVEKTLHNRRPFYGLRGEFVTAIQHFWTLGWRKVPMAAVKAFIENRDSKFKALSIEKMTYYFTRKDIAFVLSEKAPRLTMSDDKLLFRYNHPKP